MHQTTISAAAGKILQKIIRTTRIAYSKNLLRRKYGGNVLLACHTRFVELALQLALQLAVQLAVQLAAQLALQLAGLCAGLKKLKYERMNAESTGRMKIAWGRT